MTTADQIKTSHMSNWLGIIAAFVHDNLGGTHGAIAAKGDANQTALANRIDDLIEKIDHGYLIEETGERAELPRFVRTYLKTAVRHGGDA